MKILVSVKRVVDFNVRIQVKSDGSGVMTDGVKFSMNPFDEIAMEAAVKLKEEGKAEEIVAVTIGDGAAQEQLRTALAFGADRAIHVKTEEGVQPLTAARILAALTEREQPKILMMGKQAIDDDCNQTGQMAAALLDWPQTTFVSEIKFNGDAVQTKREIDAGLETLEVDLPAVITTDLRLNEPRYLKLPDIMKARQKPIETLGLDDLSVEPAPGLNVTKTSPPPQREPGVMVESAEELVAKLKDKGLL